MEDGNLQVDSLFQYSGINPDCDGEMGDDIAALQVTNLSDRFVERAELTATLLDGTGLNFVITNVPAGQTVLAFAVDNAAYPDMTVLCEHRAKSGMCSGRTYADSPEIDGTVYFTGAARPGDMVTVHITGCDDGDLAGEQIHE